MYIHIYTHMCLYLHTQKSLRRANMYTHLIRLKGVLTLAQMDLQNNVALVLQGGSGISKDAPLPEGNSKSTQTTCGAPPPLALCTKLLGLFQAQLCSRCVAVCLNYCSQNGEKLMKGSVLQSEPYYTDPYCRHLRTIPARQHGQAAPADLPEQQARVECLKRPEKFGFRVCGVRTANNKAGTNPLQ